MILKYLLIFLIGLVAVFLFRFNLEKNIKNIPAGIMRTFPSNLNKQPQVREKMLDLLAYRNGLLESNQDFLEINLVKKNVSFYQQGQSTKTVEILKLGEKETWGGTPSGLYSILARNNNAYSAGAEAYMPYALKFYGKYFLHGEPYYENGEPYISDFSGGCVQVSNEDAKEFFNLTKNGLPVLVMGQENIECSSTTLSNQLFPKIQALNYLVANLDCGEILAQKNAQEALAVGSLLDLLEAVVVAEIIDLRKDILASVKAEEMSCGGSDVLETGSYYRVIDLLYPLLSEDSTRAKWLLAAFLGRQRTPQLMQEKAKAIMMATTTVGDIFSCDGSENISTAQDLFYLAQYLQKVRPPLLAISRKERVRTFGSLPFSLKDLSNKNIFSDDESFIGGKVSVVNNSQYNGLFIFKNIAVILLGEGSLESLEKDAQQIKDWLK